MTSMKVSLDSLIFLESDSSNKQFLEEVKVICEELGINTSDVEKDKYDYLFCEHTSTRYSKARIRRRITTDAYEVDFTFDDNIFMIVVEIDHGLCIIKNMYSHLSKRPEYFWA